MWYTWRPDNLEGLLVLERVAEADLVLGEDADKVLVSLGEVLHLQPLHLRAHASNLHPHLATGIAHRNLHITRN